MLPGWILLLVSIGYAAMLFTAAWVGDRYPLYPQRPWLRPVVYSLALAVYCSSWTFYGAVGTAVHQGVGYLPIYLGPLLLLLFGWRILERLALVAQTQNTVSIADFIAARYGRSQRLAALVALIALIAAVPYLALQFKAVAISFEVLGGRDHGSAFGDPALYIAVLMAVFAILFGTREVDATEHRPGMMLAVALESLVKLVALVAVGVFAIGWLDGRNIPVADATSTLLRELPATGFVGQTLLAFVALICLPRQFHVAVVECGDVGDIRKARWMFGAYLVVVSVMVLPIAAAGIALFGRDGPVAADSFVLALPLSEHRDTLALFAYVGGFSAATGMVIVSTVALATMVSNDLIMPPLLRRGRAARHDGNIASTVLWVRRLAIIVLAALAYGYYRVSASDTSLAAYGLLAFAAVAQFGPALFGGLYWRGASRQGAEAGLLVGFAAWAYTLLLPTLTEAGWFDPAWLANGPLGIGWLRPRELFGLSGLDPLTHGTAWSLALNTGVYLLVSARWQPTLDDRLRVAPFVDPYAKRNAFVPDAWQGKVRIADLRVLANRIVGERTTARAFAEHAAQLPELPAADALADRSWIQFCERLLASAVGAASARLVLSSALKGTGMGVAEVVAVLDEAGQELRFNREILSNTLENIDQGVSVVDSDMCLVAWNRRYQQLFGYPEGMLYVGRPVADLIRYNALRGELGELPPGAIEGEVDKRIAYMRMGSQHVSERVRRDGRVIELRGQPLAGGGYVTSYVDVTDHKRAERELREINETLEQRVAERTREAEQAQESRSRFLTAISHDVLQPLNAARLFTSALCESGGSDEQRHLAERIDASLRAAEELLDGLLDVSRLDAGVLRPEISDFDAGELLRQLVAQYTPMAAARGITIRIHAPHLPVRSDRRLLRRVLQNFLANALRYTPNGRIVLAARRRGGDVELQVWDTGPGIPAIHMQQIYDEFRRYEQPFDWDGRGLGLGLSICQRISRLLGHALNARSTVGRGSMFSITVPAGDIAGYRALQRRPPGELQHGLAGMRVLCVDNDADILAGMQALLDRWQAQALCAATVDEALALAGESPHVLLVDYHLHDRLDGLDTLDALRGLLPGTPGALLTADGSDTLKQAARARGYRVLTKPVKPASLRAFLNALRRDGH